jgi:creatinine amidohydrolase/Fe(II)-dependent formamide hydrolase-like protein
MPESLYRAVLKCVCVGLRPIPAKVLVLVNGHGGGYQKDTPPLVAQELNREGFPMRVVVADVCNMAQSSPCHIDHADIGETSIALELIPQLVRMERPVGPDLFSGRKPFAQGQPSKAGGRMWWEAFLDDAEAVIGEALSS